MSTFISGRIDAIMGKAEPQESQVLRFNAATPRYRADATANNYSIANIFPQQSKVVLLTKVRLYES